MSISSEIERLEGAKNALAASIENKGVTVPADTKIDGMAALVDQIQGGGGGDCEIKDARCLFKDNARIDELDNILTLIKHPTSMTEMFRFCDGLTGTIDFGGVDTSGTTSADNMFENCYYIEEILNFSCEGKVGGNINFPSGRYNGTVQALRRLTFKNLPDGRYSIRSKIDLYLCSFERDEMVEMFNSLPDISALSISDSDKEIDITFNPCHYNGTLTDEDIAIATEKGWTIIMEF